MAALRGARPAGNRGTATTPAAPTCCASTTAAPRPPGGAAGGAEGAGRRLRWSRSGRRRWVGGLPLLVPLDVHLSLTDRPNNSTDPTDPTANHRPSSPAPPSCWTAPPCASCDRARCCGAPGRPRPRRLTACWGLPLAAARRGPGGGVQQREEEEEEAAAGERARGRGRRRRGGSGWWTPRRRWWWGPAATFMKRTSLRW